VNYRHAFHAGNFADCVKHALLLWVLAAMQRKPTPLRVLDAHAGRGEYPLDSDEARRGGEWWEGVGRLMSKADGPLVDYVALLLQLGMPGTYPGSPRIIQSQMRAGDTLVLNELHPEDHAALRKAMRGTPAHMRDAYECARALTPFPEKRGLVLFDPPFEAADEFDRLAGGMARVWARARGHVQVAWYPIKHRAPVLAFHAAIRTAGLRDAVAAELWLREPLDAARLNGCGLLVLNAPFGFEAAAADILGALVERLSEDPGAGMRVMRVADE